MLVARHKRASVRAYVRTCVVTCRYAWGEYTLALGETPRMILDLRATTTPTTAFTPQQARRVWDLLKRKQAIGNIADWITDRVVFSNVATPDPEEESGDTVATVSLTREDEAAFCAALTRVLEEVNHLMATCQQTAAETSVTPSRVPEDDLQAVTGLLSQACQLLLPHLLGSASTGSAPIYDVVRSLERTLALLGAMSVSSDRFVCMGCASPFSRDMVRDCVACSSAGLPGTYCDTCFGAHSSQYHPHDGQTP